MFNKFLRKKNPLLQEKDFVKDFIKYQNRKNEE